MPVKTVLQEKYGDVEFSWKPVESKYDLSLPLPEEVKPGVPDLGEPEDMRLPGPDAGLWPFVDMPVDEFLM